MKAYIKPEAEMIEFESEKITVNGDMGDASNTLGDEWI